MKGSLLYIHDGVGFIQGIDALLEIEADSVILDCNLSAVELGDRKYLKLGDCINRLG